MAAVTKIVIEKVLSGEFWTNSYFSSATLNESPTIAQAILAAEINIHAQAVTFTKMSISTVAVGDEVYTTIPLNVAGQYNTEGIQIAPLFVVARVDFQAAVGRPSRKYLRGVLDESDFDTFFIGAERIQQINTLYVEPLMELTQFVDIDGDALVGGSCVRQVSMRQLRRGSKKKSVQSSPGNP